MWTGVPPRYPSFTSARMRCADVAELIVMARGKLDSVLLGQVDQPSRFLGVDGKRLLDVNVAAALQAERGNRKMAFRRRRDVNDVRPEPGR